jgi:hypothetical protein
VESNVRVRSFALLGILVGSTACADNTATAPITKTPVLRRDAPSVASRGPTRFANRVKYLDKGLKHARGRAGIAATAATLEARALLGRDGSTTVDISTGSIDAPDASRLLSKVQLKQYAPNGALQTTTNYKEINSPAYQLTLSGRVRGSKLQVQGSVVGVDGKHSDVVTLTETVKLRPDVSVDRIIAPPQSHVAVPVQISALISENNGDVGARSDCVLAVDGVEAGRANGIWVDAGRSVSCVFNHVFPTTGTKQLTVSAVSVNPDDWNASNNSATQTINIALPPNNFTWSGSYISQTALLGTRLMEGYYIQTDNGARTDYREYREFRRYDSWTANIFGHVTPMTGPLTFAFRDEIDGQLLTEFEFDPATATVLEFAGTYEDPDIGTITYQGNCIDSYRLEQIVYEGQTVDVAPAFVRVCTTLRSGPSGPIPELSVTDFQYGTSAGDVSYYAETFQKFEDGTPDTQYDNTYSFNGDVDYVYGNLKFGRDYSFVFNISGPDETKTARGTIHATSFVNVDSHPYRCDDFDIGIFTGRSCSSADFTQTITSGNASGTPDE